MKSSKKISLGAVLGFVMIMLTAQFSGGAGKTIDWNVKSIKWQDYNAGLEAGRRNINRFCCYFMQTGDRHANSTLKFLGIKKLLRQPRNFPWLSSMSIPMKN